MCPSIFSDDTIRHDCDECKASRYNLGDSYDESVCYKCWKEAATEAYNKEKEALQKVKRLNEVYPRHGIVQEELPRVSKNTLNALVSKGVLRVDEGVFGEDGPVYYYWTGEELE